MPKVDQERLIEKFEKEDHMSALANIIKEQEAV
jgi:hypothetical protein